MCQKGNVALAHVAISQLTLHTYARRKGIRRISMEKKECCCFIFHLDRISKYFEEECTMHGLKQVGYSCFSQSHESRVMTLQKFQNDDGGFDILQPI